MTTQSARNLRGIRVFSGADSAKGIGKVIQPLVHPTEPRVLGLLVSRPDLLLMVKRSDRFVSLDACNVMGTGIAAPAAKENWDDGAFRRLEVNPDSCRTYMGQRVLTQSGQNLGTVGDVLFDWDNGAISQIITTQGNLSDKLKGQVVIPLEMMLGYASDGTILVKEEVVEAQRMGGVSEMAGVAAEKASVAAEKAKAGAKAAGTLAETAVEKGSKVVGKRIGETKDAFAAFKEEYKKARAGEDQD